MDTIRLSREVEAVLIPSGDAVVLEKDTEVTITQALGGSYTVLFSRGMARVRAEDADALGKELSQAAAAQEAADGGPEEVSEERVLDALRMVFDPEIPVNIVDLGLVYECKITSQGSDDGGGKKVRVDVKMTLTAPGCGMGGVISGDARDKILALPGVAEAEVELVWDPPWNQSMISERGKMQLGLI